MNLITELFIFRMYYAFRGMLIIQKNTSFSLFYEKTFSKLCCILIQELYNIVFVFSFSIVNTTQIMKSASNG